MSMMVDRSGCTAPRHGTFAAYTVVACRCPDAREARRLYLKRRREGRPEIRLVAAIGTTRRLQALQALGHPPSELAYALGLSVKRVYDITRHRCTTVQTRTFRSVATLYDQLSMTPGTCNRTRLMAGQAGWVPPLAWDDDQLDNPNAKPNRGSRRDKRPDRVHIELALAGNRTVPLSHQERLACVERLWDAADSYIADRVGMSIRTVQRLRREIEQQQAQEQGAAA